MRLTFIMSAVRTAKPPLPERVPSGSNKLKPKGAPFRAFHPNSSPVYKTQSDSALSAGVRNLTIKDNGPLKRTLFNRGSGNQSVKSLSDVASLLQSEAVKNVVVVAGAGISTPSGIPDFRSPGTGLYDNLQQYNIPYPEAIFDIDYFHQNPRPFFTLAKELYPSGKYRPNYIHYLVRLLYDKEMLLRMYTQNIDGLERLAGIPAEKLVEAHGTFATATCTVCQKKMDGSEIKEKIFSDKLPRCPTRGCMGIIKPDIVFFGEDLPRKFYHYMKDMLQTDLVLVMGTSLEVQPFAGIIDTVRFNVPRVLFNRDAVGPFRYSRRANDFISPGDLITNMQKFVTMIGWRSEMVDLITKEEGEFKVSVPAPSTNGQNGNTTTQQNNQKNYNNLIYGQNSRIQYFRFRDSDSSTSESETESESSSSDSSVEEMKSRKPVIKRGSSNSLNNNNQKGGNLRNGFRSKSAKPDPTNNNRKIHTGVDKTVKGGSNIGNLTGRSVKSESGINGNLGKRRIENKKLKPITNKLSSTKVSSTDDIEKIERDKVLKKYGINPNSKSPYTNIDKTIAKKDKTFKISDTYVKKQSPVENNKISLEQTVETQIERDKQLDTSPVLEREIPLDHLPVSEKILPSDTEERPTFYIGETGETENTSVKKENKKVLQNYDNGLQNHDDNSLTVKVEHSLTNKNEISAKECVTTEKLQEELDNKMTKVADILNDPKNCKVVSETLNHNLPPPVDYKDKIAQLRKLAARQKDQERVERMKMLQNSKRPKALNTLNTKPYGYSAQFKRPLQQGVGPFQRTSVRTLDSCLDRSDTMYRSGSAELPKLSFRHRLQPTGTAKYDPRMFGQQTPQDTGSEENGSSDDDYR